MKTKIKVSISTNKLSEATKETMWEVYRHYYHYDKAFFMQRIESNNYYSFYKANGAIIGFTGLRVNRTEIDGKRQLLVYFGQTVIDEKYRGKSLIPVTGAKLCMKFWKEIFFSDVYFWADSLTYKAYLVFAKTVEEIYPSWKRKMPETIKTITDHLGQTHYQQKYCAETGTVRKEQLLVNDTTTQIPQKYQLDDDIRFYVQANPNYKQGHGLLTITPMNKKNIQLLFSRYLQKMLNGKPQRQEGKSIVRHLLRLIFRPISKGAKLI